MIHITPTTIAVVVASLATAGSAAADVNIDASGHGGRAAEPLTRAAVASSASGSAITLGGESQQQQPVVARVSKGRHSARFSLSFTAPCNSGGDPSFAETNFAATIRKGRYKVSKTEAKSFDDGYALVESYKASGRLVKNHMSGVMRIKDTWYQPNGSQEDFCDSGRQKFSLSRTGVFAGSTNEGDPVVLPYTASRDRVKSVMIPWFAECESGSWIWGTTHLADSVRSGGAFGGTWSKAVASANGDSTTSTYVLGGVLLGQSAFGTWNVHASITDASQKVVDTCDTDQISYRVN